jgi:hypothetical protein
MNRWFPRHAQEALFGVAAALGAIGAVGCSPTSGVQPGPPVLTEMIILQAGPAGTMATTILPTTPTCTPVGGVVDGTPCNPAGDPDAGVPADALCQAVDTVTWCTCGGSDPMTPTWSCPSSFAATTGVIAIFDRLLDTAPFDAVDGGPATNVASLSGVGIPMMDLPTDYASNGSTTGLIFPLLGKFVVGNFRVDGPSLLMSPSTAFPSGATLTVGLNKLTVRSKAGQPFVSAGPLLDGIISFKTAPFTVAGITTPPGVDGGTEVAPDMTPATITFTNFVSVADVMSHITVTAGATAVPVPVDIASSDNLNVTITPKTTWPASSTITITVDQTTPDVNGEALSAAVPPAMFTTSAS